MTVKKTNTAAPNGKKATAPEAKAPEAKAPEATAPEATAPEATAPEAKAPEATSPEAKAPEATAPEVEIPEGRIKELSSMYNVPVFFFTSDGTAFTEEQHARGHAANLGDDIVTPIDRED